MDIMLLIVGALLGSVTSLFLTPLTKDKVQLFLIKVVGASKLRKPQNLDGIWSTRWHVKSSSFPPIVEDPEVKVKSLGNKISGTFKVAGRKKHFIGSIDKDKFITGTWHDEMEGTTYHGAFQLQILPNAEIFEGIWIGFSKNNDIKSGKWEWKRPHVLNYPSEQFT